MKKVFAKTRRKMAELSTAHVTENDNVRLRGAYTPAGVVMVAPYSHGYLVSVPPPDELRKKLAEVLDSGLSASFANCLRKARAEGVDFLMFDADAPRVEGLKAHGW